MPSRRLVILSALLGVACHGAGEAADYRVVRKFPHDVAAYTQGLVYENGTLYESTGEYGRSQLRRVILGTGAVEQSHPLDAKLFGEGLAFLGGKLYQVTWQSQRGYVYDASTFQVVDSFTYAGEGWGLATDGTSLILSDGTSTLRFLDPQTRAVTKTVDVRSRGAPVRAINELEYVNGELFANVYQTDYILRIDPATGEVKQWLDFTDLLPQNDRKPGTDVLNGIALDRATGHLLLTGKRWPTLFEVELKR